MANASLLLVGIQCVSALNKIISISIFIDIECWRIINETEYISIIIDALFLASVENTQFYIDIFQYRLRRSEGLVLSY
ncbi:MAG: hypothetical protein ACPG3T_03285 [Pseudomonadales bacterium]